MRKLGILRFGNIDNDLILFITNELGKIFSNVFNKVEVLKKIEKIPPIAFNQQRNQYKAPLIMEVIRSNALNSGYDKILGIVNVDLYVPNLNFIFGQAEFSESGKDTRACIISITRLMPSFYKNIELNKDLVKLLYLRTLKEALHEIGHTLGLRHCNSFNCVMRFSNCLEDTDEKPAYF